MDYISTCFNSLSSEWIPTPKQYSRFLSNCNEDINGGECIYWDNHTLYDNEKIAHKNTFYFNGEKRPIKNLV